MTVEKIIADHLDIDINKVIDDAHLVDDLGADSLHIVELVMAFETEYDFDIPDEDAEQLVTVKAIKQYVEDYA
jgi:acyl carrier protein